VAAPVMQVSQRLQVCYLGVIEAINASQLDPDQWQTGRIAWRRARGCQPTTEGACQAWDGFDLSPTGKLSVKQVRPCSEVTATFPLWASTIARVMDRPSPAPSLDG
jgi:hypothetical protein